MRFKRPLQRGFVCLTAALLAACSSLDGPDSARESRDPEDLTLYCTDRIQIGRGAYRVENNTWGKGSLRGWRQCVGLDIGQDNTAVAHFTWDWPLGPQGIKAYPEIIYGRKPGTASTTQTLPRRIQDVHALSLDYAIDATHHGVGNIAIDLWLTESESAATFRSPPITHEIMVWLGSFGGLKPSGQHSDTAEIDGLVYDIFVHLHPGGWRYIAFMPHAPLLGAHHLDIRKFLTHVQHKGVLSGREYVASLELGAEIESGHGALRVHRFRVDVLAK